MMPQVSESTRLVCSYLGFRKLCSFQPTKRTLPPNPLRTIRNYTPWVGKRDSSKYAPWKGKRSPSGEKRDPGTTKKARLPDGKI